MKTLVLGEEERCNSSLPPASSPKRTRQLADEGPNGPSCWLATFGDLAQIEAPPPPLANAKTSISLHQSNALTGRLQTPWAEVPVA